MASLTMPSRVQFSLAGFPGMGFMEAMQRAQASRPREALLGELALDEVQLCPQNRGILTREYAEALKLSFPQTQFRLHANVRVLANRQIQDWADFSAASPYWQSLAQISQSFGAPAYTAHAGRRCASTMTQMLEAARRASDLFGCPVGVEGHYPTRSDLFLVSHWEEYRALYESGVPYVVDLSHLNIVAEHSGRQERGLVQDMLAGERCLEVHFSANDGTKDQHRTLDVAPWWWDLIGAIHPKAVIFSEGEQASPANSVPVES